MGRISPLFVSLLGALYVIGVSGQSAAECIGRCTNNVRDKFKDLQCSDANAAACFCKNPTFPRAVLECSQSCGATMDMVSGYLTSDFCKAQGLVKPSDLSAVHTSASSTSASSQTAAPSASITPTAQTTLSSSATVPTSTSTSTGVTSTSSSASVSAATETTTTSAASSTDSDTAASATSSTTATSTDTAAATAASTPASNGLPQAAIAGIGIGVGAAVIAIVGIVICMLLKSRRRKADRYADNMEISKPLPGSGRMDAYRQDNYRAGRDASFEKFGNDIEMTSNRYEDMVPRTKPRTMV